MMGDATEEHSGDDYVAVFCQYFEDLGMEQFEDLMLQENERHFYSVNVDAVLLLNHNVKAGYMLLSRPTETIPWAERGAVLTQETLLRKIAAAGNASEALALRGHHEGYTVKRNVKVRVVNLPLTEEFCKRSITALRAEDAGQLISIRGIVIREGSVRMFEATKQYACDMCLGSPAGKKCVDALSPVYGPGVVQRAPKCDSCGREMSPVPLVQSEVASRLRDYQELRLQDQVTNLSAGTIPRSITVILEDDLAESCRAGDDLVAVGVLTQRWHREPKADQRSSIELVLLANQISVTNEVKTAAACTIEEEEQFKAFWKRYANDRLRGRDILVGSVCPQVYGMQAVKLGLLLVLIGGYAVEGTGEGSRTRGDCHMLLVGDPGTGKSQFLQFAAKLSARSVCTTGIGSTSAGLTVSAYKDAGEWVLDAGALVIADGGVCCIDEFSTIPEAKHVAIHEAMEQQTVSVAKAGLVTTLNTRCSVVAACNPKKDQVVSEGETSIGIATPLLSRFDLVMVMMDAHDTDWDSKLASFILRRSEEKPWEPQAEDAARRRREDTRKAGNHWDVEKLRSYIEWAKSKKSKGLPPIATDARVLLETYFNGQRENRSRLNQSRRTIRMLESLIRLAQAHSLLVGRDEVTLDDATVAVSLMDYTCDQSSSSSDPPLQSAASGDPERQLRQSLQGQLQRLGLEDHPAFSTVQPLTPPAGGAAKRLAYDARFAYRQDDDPSESMAALFASRRITDDDGSGGVGGGGGGGGGGASMPPPHRSGKRSAGPPSTRAAKRARQATADAESDDDVPPSSCGGDDDGDGGAGGLRVPLNLTQSQTQDSVVMSLAYSESHAAATPSAQATRETPGGDRLVLTPDVRETSQREGKAAVSSPDGDGFELDLDLDLSPFRALSQEKEQDGGGGGGGGSGGGEKPPPKPSKPLWADLDVNSVHPDRLK